MSGARASTGHAKASTGPSTPGAMDAAALRDLAIGVLADAAQDADAPAATRVAAAAKLLDALGMGKAKPSDTDQKPVSEMTLAELDAAIAAASVPG